MVGGPFSSANWRLGDRLGAVAVGGQTQIDRLTVGANLRVAAGFASAGALFARLHR